MLPKIGLILLAAGGSTRMGQPKQLLQYKGQSLLRRAAEQAAAIGCDPVIVVLGAGAPRLKAELTNLPVHIMENPDWQQGMGTSIRTGLSAMPAQPIIITLCDQPLIDAAALEKLIDAYRTKNPPIVAAQYAGTLGVPALFSQEFFPSLASLPDDAGAKKILMQHADQVFPVPMEHAATDIDTPADYQQLPE